MTSSDEIFTVESFLFVCKEVGISISDLGMMDIGDCLDFIQEFVDSKRTDGKGKASTRKATQSDFDNF